MTPKTKQVQTAVTAAVWKSIARGDVDVSGIDKNELDKLVDLMVDAALSEVDDQLEQISVDERQTDSRYEFSIEADAEDDDDPEEVLWEGRPFLSLTRRYIITNHRIRIIEGLLGKSFEDIELVRVQDVDMKQSMSERTLDLGDVIIASHDSDHPQAALENVKDPRTVHEILRKAVIAAREKYRLSYREEM